VTLALVLGVLALGAFAWPALGLDVSIAWLAEVIRGWGVWGAAGAVGLMILHSFVPFPAELLACANGMVYGPVWGTVVTWTGAMIGAFVAFAIARSLGRPVVARILAERHRERLDAWATAEGWRIALVSRLIPVIAFNLVNYAAGLSRLSLWDFTWTTAVGILPATVVMVIAGDQAEHFGWPVWLGFAAGAIALWYVTSRRRR